MKTTRIVSVVLALAAGIFLSGSLAAHEAHKKGGASESVQKGELVPAAELDAAWLEKARASYPLNECVVSGDEFDGGPMGNPMDFAYREDGKPDRLVRFCCKDCIKDFEKNPAKYLAEIEVAAKAKDHH